MTSLNSCVQEFIDQHSSTLFSSDTTEVRHPRFSRFNSNPLSSVDIEDEDPNLYVITPPIEHFLHVSSRLCREQFFKLIRPGHLLICHVLTASSRDMLVRLLCFDDGHRRAFHDLKLTATCLLNTSGIKNQNNRRRNKYDRDVQEMSDDEKDDGEYQSGDFIRACVSHVDVHKEDIQLAIDPSNNQHHQLSKKLGLINQDDLPTHYVLLRRQEEETQSYEDILQTSKAFCNRACVQTLYQRLKQRFEQIQSPDPSSSHSKTNDILHMTLINSFKRKQIPSDEYFDKLRQKQDRDWAMESVAVGIRLMKEDRASSAVLHFNKALSTDPTCVDALVARGALSANQGHYKRAMQDFEDALQIDRQHINALKYLHDVLMNIAKDTDDYDDAIHYLEKALKYKPNDNETKRQLDMLQTKKKEAVRKLEYGPSLPSNLSASSKGRRVSRTSRRRTSSVKGSSSMVSLNNGPKRKRSSSSATSTHSSSGTTSSQSSSSSSSSSSSTSSTSRSLSTISSSSSKSNKKKSPKTISVIDITGSDPSTTTRSSNVSIPSSSDKSKSMNVDSNKSMNNDNHHRNGNSMISNQSRFYSNTRLFKSKSPVKQRKTLPSTMVSSSLGKTSVSLSSSSKRNTSARTNREDEDIEKFYKELKAKQSMEKRKK